MKHLFLAIALLAATCNMGAQQVNPITKAVLDSYGAILAENPDDYLTLYERATQYFNMGLYDKAVDDVARAISCTPSDNKPLLASEYQLLATVELARNRYDSAMEAVNKGLTYSPSGYALLYLKGNAALHLKDTATARDAFAAMQRQKSRSQEALFGLAKVDIMEQKYGDAQEKMKSIEEMKSADAITYCRLGDLYMDMNDRYGASMQYVSAFALADDDRSRAIESLYKVAQYDYDAAIRAIDFAITKAPQSQALVYLKGNIAFHCGHNADALDAFSQVISSSPEGVGASLYHYQAQAALNLNRADRALSAANMAVQIDPKAEYLLTLAQVYASQGNHQRAYEIAGQARQAAPSAAGPLIICALEALALNNSQEAVDLLGQAVMYDAADPYPILIRGWIYANVLHDPTSAQADYNRAAALPASSVRQKALQGLAQAGAGKTMDAGTTIHEAEQLVKNAEDCIWVARAYANTGNIDKAGKLIDRARAMGYDNIYVTDCDATPGMSIKHIKNKD